MFVCMYVIVYIVVAVIAIDRIVLQLYTFCVYVHRMCCSTSLKKYIHF